MGSRVGDGMRSAAVSALASVTSLGRAATRGAAHGVHEVGWHAAEHLSCTLCSLQCSRGHRYDEHVGDRLAMEKLI
jgi:hypothetical protein